MTEEEIKKLKDFKVYVFEGEVYVKAEDFKEIAIENKKLKEELEWYKTEHERLVDKLVIKGATELLDRKFENKKGWQGK